MSAATRIERGLVRRTIAGAARDGAAGQPVGQQLHVLVPAAANQPAELLGCERKTWIIIDRVPQSRPEEPPYQASQPPHINSLAPATNLLVRILFLPQLRDCKRPLATPHQKFPPENNLLLLAPIGKTHVTHELMVVLAVRANRVRGKAVGVSPSQRRSWCSLDEGARLALSTLRRTAGCRCGAQNLCY
nr:hypothetical protein BDOA9_0141680 [Bradyrhizobium sp. DOA9]